MKIGIIGGSGLDDPQILQNVEEKQVNTPFGSPSSAITCGRIGDIEVCILARHGKRHQIPPTQVNYRANVYALGKLGCTHIIATTACGSLKQEIGRGDFVILDQFIDFTRRRELSYFEEFKEGEAKHTPMAEPFSKELREKIIASCREIGIKHHKKGTVVTIEGPRFSTRAESNMFRQWGADVINMSVAPEAILANEAELQYAVIAMSTDYDCWKTDEEPVSWDAILQIFNQNADKMKTLLIKVIENLGKKEIENSDSWSAGWQSEETSVSSVTDEEFIKSKIKTLPNWPKPGVMFRDINSLLRDTEGFQKAMNLLEKRYKEMDIDVIAGIESRGFIIGSILATRMNKPFVLIRKPGKLPFEVLAEEYQLEYGTDKVEVQREAIAPGQKVLVVDDLCATGGTAEATCKLIERLGGHIVECGFVMDLPDLGGSTKLKAKWPVYKIVDFEGE